MALLLPPPQRPAEAAPSGAASLLAVIALEMTTALIAATLLARLRAHARPADPRLNGVSR